MHGLQKLVLFLKLYFGVFSVDLKFGGGPAAQAFKL